LKSDKRVPSTFKQPDDPPAGVQMVDSPVADKFEVRFITRGTSRSSNDLAAYNIAAAVIDDRLKAQMPAGANGTVAVESIDHVLPGAFVIKFSGAKQPGATKIEANDVVPKALSAPVTDAEFQKVRPLALRQLLEYNIYDRWLDVDTYKIGTLDAFNKRITSVSLANVQDVMSRLKGQPMAAIVVSSGKPSE
jgi:hypothetical protein